MAIIHELPKEALERNRNSPNRSKPAKTYRLESKIKFNNHRLEVLDFLLDFDINLANHRTINSWYENYIYFRQLLDNSFANLHYYDLQRVEEIKKEIMKLKKQKKESKVNLDYFEPNPVVDIDVARKRYALSETTLKWLLSNKPNSIVNGKKVNAIRWYDKFDAFMNYFPLSFKIVHIDDIYNLISTAIYFSNSSDFQKRYITELEKLKEFKAKLKQSGKSRG